MRQLMRGSYCYLPILRAKQGEFGAVRGLSSAARARLVPMFDVPNLGKKKDESLDTYLAACAEGIAGSWGSLRPVYVDLHDLPRELRTADGVESITFLFDRLREYRATAVPVTGVESERGKDYLLAVRDIIRRDERGACLRLFEEDFSELRELPKSIKNLLVTLGIEPADLDVVIDSRYTAMHNLMKLRNDLMECIRVLRSIGRFRNITIAGGSEPDGHGKQYRGKIRRTPRVEFKLWEECAKLLGQIDGIAFGDYGIIHPYFTVADGPVKPPARIRYTTENDSVSYHGERGNYLKLCRQLIESTDFKGQSFSRGDLDFYRRAKGMTGSGNPTTWVETDTNHHLELVSVQTWELLIISGLAAPFSLPDFKAEPVLQVELEMSV